MRWKYKSESQNRWGQKGPLEIALSTLHAQSQLIYCKVPRAVYGWFFNLPDGDCTTLLSNLLQCLAIYRTKSFFLCLNRILCISTALKPVSISYTFPSGILYTLIRSPWVLCCPGWTVPALPVSPHDRGSIPSSSLWFCNAVSGKSMCLVIRGPELQESGCVSPVWSRGERLRALTCSPHSAHSAVGSPECCRSTSLAHAHLLVHQNFKVFLCKPAFQLDSS